MRERDGLMSQKRARFVVFALVAAAFAALSAAATAVPVNRAGVEKVHRTQDLTAQTRRRPHVIIRPRRLPLSPNARRICASWLAQEYRVSGPVITPRLRCWWEQ